MKLAVAGAGLIGRKHATLVSDHARLSALIDPDPAAEEFAKSLDAQWFPGIAQCLATDPPDGVIVAVPNQHHVSVSMACVQAGVPVLVEKPIAARADEALRLVEASEGSGIPVLVGHHRRHSAIARKVREVVDTGTLGDIVTVDGQFWLYKPDDYFQVEWRVTEGGGPVFINLIHDIDLIRYFCGEVVGVQAQLSNRQRGHAVEDTAAILLHLENGALGTVTVSDSVAAPWSWEFTAGENPAYPNVRTSCYKLGGTKGALSIPDMTLWRHPGERSWWAPIEGEQISVETADPLLNQLRHFQSVIRGEAQPLVTAREGMKTLQVIEAIRNAADSQAYQAV